MTGMAGATGSRSHTRRGWWLAGALALALGALLAWTAWQNEALRGRVAALEEENRSLAQTLAARAAATAPPAMPAPVASVAAAPVAPMAPVPASDALAAYARAPGSSPRQGPLEEALQRLREPAPRAGTSPFGRP